MENHLNRLIDSFMKMRDSDPLIFLDYDGTLVGIRMNPEDATADEGLLDQLHQLSDLYETYIVTGRSMKDIEGFIGYDFNVIALHGALSRINGVYFENVENFSGYEKICDAIFEDREEYVSNFPGLRIYNKHGNLLFHFGLMAGERKDELIDEVKKLAVRNSMDLYLGKMIVELRVPGINKGIAIRRTRRGRPSLIAGDDTTDEEAFMLNSDALRVRIGEGETCADYTIESPEVMREIIDRIIEISK